MFVSYHHFSYILAFHVLAVLMCAGKTGSQQELMSALIPSFLPFLSSLPKCFTSMLNLKVSLSFAAACLNILNSVDLVSCFKSLASVCNAACLRLGGADSFFTELGGVKQRSAFDVLGSSFFTVQFVLDHALSKHVFSISCYMSSPTSYTPFQCQDKREVGALEFWKYEIKTPGRVMPAQRGWELPASALPSELLVLLLS